MKGIQGGSTGGVEKSPQRRKREAARRKAQEARWAAKSGPVTVRKVSEPSPDETEPDSRS